MPLVIALGLVIAGVEIVLPYPRFAAILKGLTLIIFAYVAAAFLAQPDWRGALRDTAWPHLALTRDEVLTVVAILGTTISPYLFFWQTAQEVEEETSRGIVAAKTPVRRLQRLLRDADLDVAAGMAVAVLVAMLIIWLSPIKDVTPELRARTQPTLLDLGVAHDRPRLGRQVHGVVVHPMAVADFVADVVPLRTRHLAGFAADALGHVDELGDLARGRGACTGRRRGRGRALLDVERLQ